MVEEPEEREESLHGLEKLRATRIEKAEALRTAGTNPYPYRFEVTHAVAAVRAAEKPLAEAGSTVRVAGRVMALRGHGKTAFGHIEDSSGRMQFYVKRDDVGEDTFRRFELVDLGDIVGIAGTVFRTAPTSSPSKSKRWSSCPRRSGRCRRSGTASPTRKFVTGSATSTSWSIRKCARYS